MGCLRRNPRPVRRSRASVRSALHVVLSLAISSAAVQAQASARLAPAAARYLDGALATLERASIHRETVNWKALHDSAYSWAAGAATAEETWPAIHRTLKFVDRHSFLLTPRPMLSAAYGPGNVTTAAVSSPAPPGVAEPRPKLLDRIGYIVVPGFEGPNRPLFVDSLQQSIRDLDEAGACGWIVDLRFNLGGNMWPMLAGVGPLLDGERVGAFVDARGVVQDWHYRDGQAWAGHSDPPTSDGLAAKGRMRAYRLRTRDAPVALLLSSATASSGEAVAVAFLGRSNLRTFGDSTAGFNSANGTYPLPDGARMIITNGMNRDRRGRSYALTIAPDELVPWRSEDEQDAPVQRAGDWLSEQRRCVEAKSRGDERRRTGTLGREQQARSASSSVAATAIDWERGPASVQTSLTVAMEEALRSQRAAWKQLEQDEHPALSPPQDAEPHMSRAMNTECNTGDSLFYPSWTTVLESRPLRFGPQVRSRGSTHSQCPAWLPRRVLGVAGNTHEYRGDGRAPSALAPFSPALVTALERAFRQWPETPFFRDQLVRVLVENGDVDGARAGLSTCPPTDAWCAGLRLYAAVESARWLEADSLAEWLWTGLPTAGRCSWFGLSQLLPAGNAASEAYRALDCDERLAWDERGWWLADPFWSRPGNPRRSTQLARLVRVQLVHQLPLDPLADLRIPYGGDAVIQLRLRYGWPDHMVWVGQKEEDRVVGLWRGRGGSEPLGAPEYKLGRAATLPAPEALQRQRPLADSMFTLGPPAGTDPYRWWPIEHYADPDGLIFSLPQYQAAMLRRPGHTLFVQATALTGALLDSVSKSKPTTVRAALVLSPDPDHRTVVARDSGRAGQVLGLGARITAPTIVSTEYLVQAQGIAGARRRFAVTEPPTLERLGTPCGLSDLLLVEPDAVASSSSAPYDPVRGLLGSRRVVNPEAIGLRWESYGVHPEDSTTVTLRLAREVDLGRLQRVGIALGVVEDPNVALRISWTDPTPSYAARVVVADGAERPILARELTLNVARLRAGVYALELRVESRRCGVLETRTAVAIER